MKHALTRAYTAAAALTLTLLPSVAHAHIGLGHTSGFVDGFIHPLAGLDHAAAMFAVGLWAAQHGGRAIWVLPLAFAIAMLFGGFAGALGFPLPYVETGVMASLLVLGGLVAAAAQLPLVAAGALVGAFAFFHGHAHGTEITASASGFAYVLGLAVSTAALHAAGIGAVAYARKCAMPQLARLAGGAVAALGAILAFA